MITALTREPHPEKYVKLTKIKVISKMVSVNIILILNLNF